MNPSNEDKHENGHNMSVVVGLRLITPLLVVLLNIIATLIWSEMRHHAKAIEVNQTAIIQMRENYNDLNIAVRLMENSVTSLTNKVAGIKQPREERTV